jgi:hypothetical protein
MLRVVPIVISLQVGLSDSFEGQPVEDFDDVEEVPKFDQETHQI